MDATRSSKKARPSFDVARAEVGGQGDAWVYRSDTPSAPAGPAAPRAEPPAPVHVERPAPASSASTERGPGWIKAGISVMALPLTLTMLVMIAPALWVAGAHPRR